MKRIRDCDGVCVRVPPIRVESASRKHGERYFLLKIYIEETAIILPQHG